MLQDSLPLSLESNHCDHQPLPHFQFIPFIPIFRSINFFLLYLNTTIIYLSIHPSFQVHLLAEMKKKTFHVSLVDIMPALLARKYLLTINFSLSNLAITTQNVYPSFLSLSSPHPGQCHCQGWADITFLFLLLGPIMM